MDVHERPPVYDGDSFSTSWLSSVLGENVQHVKHLDLTDVGGMMCALQRIVVTCDSGSKTFVFKQIHVSSVQKTETSRSLGLIRESLFYKSELSKKFGSLIAKCYYAYGSEVTGEKYMLLEDLSPAIPAGFFFGPGNPNNWSKKDQLLAICEPSMKEGTDVEVVSRQSFKDMARIHASFWKNEALKSVCFSWLRGNDWWNHKGQESFDRIQGDLTNTWARVKGKIDPSGLQDNGVQWDLDFIKLIDASFSRISFEGYTQWTDKTPWTFVLGDCHPANALWVPGVPLKDAVKFVDFEMVAVGSGPQDLAQYLISHMEPQKRKQCEKSLVRTYYDELISHGVQNFTWDECWMEYVRGGSERWIWLVAFMAPLLPKEMGTFFNNQVVMFCSDHGVTCDTIGQPRP